nr:histidine kinase [uncultured Dyadobacter sp.]
METLTEELYTYRKVLFPATQSRRVLIQCAFWTLFIVFHLLVFLPAHQDRLTNRHVLFSYILYYGRYIPVYYLTIRFFRFLRSRVRSPYRLIWMAVFVLIIFHIITMALFQFYSHKVGMENLPDGFQKIGKLYLLSFEEFRGRDWLLFIYNVSDLQLLVLPLSIKMIKYSIGLVSEEYGRREQKLRSELKYMRSQLTPHFIFNILNAVSVEIRHSPKKAIDILFKAADMIRFSIYDIEKEFISLKKELHYVQQYVELESMRTSHRSQICFLTRGDVLEEHRVPTLFLVTLVENAFKHSVHATADRSEVSILGEIRGDWLTFEVTNTKPAKRSAEPTNKTSEGIGLANIKKTLALKFGKNYSFDIIQDTETFSVLLKLPLHSGGHLVRFE